MSADQTYMSPIIFINTVGFICICIKAGNPLKHFRKNRFYVTAGKYCYSGSFEIRKKSQFLTEAIILQSWQLPVCRPPRILINGMLTVEFWDLQFTHLEIATAGKYYNNDLQLLQNILKNYAIFNLQITAPEESLLLPLQGELKLPILQRLKSVNIFGTIPLGTKAFQAQLKLRNLLSTIVVRVANLDGLERRLNTIIFTQAVDINLIQFYEFLTIGRMC